MTKYITISEILSPLEIEAIGHLVKNSLTPQKTILEYISPRMPVINKKLGQENDASYLAYVISFAFSSTENVTKH